MYGPQVLLAVMAGMYAVYHGPARLKNIAVKIHYLTALLNKCIADAGYRQSNEYFFDTLEIDLSDDLSKIDLLKESCCIIKYKSSLQPGNSWNFCE